MPRIIPMKIIDAQNMLADFRPYLSSIIYGSRFVENHDCPSLSADQKMRIHYNPDFLEKTDTGEICAMLYRQVLAICYEHSARAESLKEKGAVGIASVMETSSRMQSEGIIETDAPLPEDFGLEKGEVLEEYYREIVALMEAQEERREQSQNQNKDQGQGQNKDQGQGQNKDQGQGQNKDQEQGQSEEQEQGQNEEQEQGQNEEQEQGQNEDFGDLMDSPDFQDQVKREGKKEEQENNELPNGKKMPDIGSAFTGKEAPWEKNAEEEGLSERDVSDILDGIKRDLSDLKKKSPSEQKMHLGRGVDPSTVLDIAEVEQMDPSDVPWEQKFSHLIARDIISKQAMSGRTSYEVRSQYQDSMEIIGEHEPILAGHLGGKPRVGILVDKSGSMDIEKISLAFTEINSLIKKANLPHVSLYQGDEKLVAMKRNVRTLRSDDLMEGSGGTKMEVVMTEINRLSEKPDVLVVLSDADTDWPQKGEMGMTKIIIGLINATQEAVQKVPEEYGRVEIGKTPKIDNASKNRFRI